MLVYSTDKSKEIMLHEHKSIEVLLKINETKKLITINLHFNAIILIFYATSSVIIRKTRVSYKC